MRNVEPGQCKVTYVLPCSGITAGSLFVQQDNNRNDLVPIAICCSLLDAGLDLVGNSLKLLSAPATDEVLPAWVV